MLFTCTCSNNFKKNFKFPSQVVDRFEKPDIIGGSLRRKGLRVFRASRPTVVIYHQVGIDC